MREKIEKKGTVSGGFTLSLLLLLAITLLASCSGREESAVSYYDIISQERKLFPSGTEEWEEVLGMQFYRGEPVKLLRVTRYEDGAVQRDVFLCEADGARRLLQENTVDFYLFAFLDEEGYLYTVLLSDSGSGAKSAPYRLVKWDGEGKKIFETGLEAYVRYLGQLDGGELVIKTFGKVPKLLDPQTGRLSEPEGQARREAEKALFLVGTKEDALLAASARELWRIDVRTGETEPVLSCVGTTYELTDVIAQLSGCRISEEGKPQLLYQSSRGGEGTLETLSRVNVGDGKTPVTVRAMRFTDDGGSFGWLKDRVLEFNGRPEGKYFVVLEECPDGTAEEDYARMTSVEMAAKKGPDILLASAFGEYIQGLVEKGAVEDLSGYMEKAGLREEDYFPGAFSCYRTGKAVYGVTPTLWFVNYMIDGEVLNMDEAPDVEELVGALRACPEPILFGTESPQGIVRLLLCGSEDLWGMIDPKAGRCDFGGELFAGILEAALKCGYVPSDGRDYVDMDELLEKYALAVDGNSSRLYSYRNREEQERAGTVPFGVLFDEGCFPLLSDERCMVMNRNSGHKDGAWEFLCFLLQEESQKKASDGEGGYPASREAFEQLLIREKAEGPVKRNGSGLQYTAGDGKPLTEQDMEEFRQLLGEARYACFQTEEIIDIICEEAQEYFDGVKTVEQVAETAENRVGLYLQEWRGR